MTARSTGHSRPVTPRPRTTTPAATAAALRAARDLAPGAARRAAQARHAETARLTEWTRLLLRGPVGRSTAPR